MTMLDDAITEGWANARREDPEPTVDYFRGLLIHYPDARQALFAYASALDFAGRDPRPLLSAGRSREALAGLITLALDRIDSEDLQRYHWALRRYATALD